MRCGICSNPQRKAIEAAASVAGASVIAIAKQYGVTKASLAKHIATHDRAARPVASVPAAAPPAAGAGRPAEQRVDEPPATARAHIEDVLSRIRTLVDNAERVGDGTRCDDCGHTPEETPPRDQAVLLTAAMTAIKLLGQLTGELGASEATIASSPHWKKLQREIIEALRPYPDAMRAVVARIERLDRQEAAA